MVHGEAVVMLAGDHDVLHPGILRHLDPFVRVEFDGIELAGEFLVFGHRDLGAVHDPLADAGDGFAVPLARRNGIQAPVNEQSEFCIPEPFHFGVLGGGSGERRSLRRRRAEDRNRGGKDEKI